MMLSLASKLLGFLLLLFPHLILSSKTEQQDISPESLQFIQRVPCSEPQGRCSLKDFVELRGEKNFFEEWMLVLYFDFDRYSSHDTIVGIVPGAIHIKLFRHKILFGRVFCSASSESIAANAKLCKDADPSVIYAFQHGRKMDYWWTVSDLINYRAFVMGNLLTAQYTELIETIQGKDFDEETQSSWQTDPESRKFMVAVHLSQAEKVNASERVRAFDLLGVIVRTIPDVRIIILPEVIKEDIEIWWYDSRRCPKLNESNCEKHHISLKMVSKKDTDELLCEIEKFSAGLNISNAWINLLPNSSENSSLQESHHRLLLACPFLFYKVEDEKPEDLQPIMDHVPKNFTIFISVIGDQKLALSTLISHGENPETANKKILIKYHTDVANLTNTDIFSRMTTPAGLEVRFAGYRKNPRPKTLRKMINFVFNDVHYTSNYDEILEEYSPYKETDELSLILESSKQYSLDDFKKLNEKDFQRRLSDGHTPFTVLFFVQWSPASLVASNVVFPAASKELKSRFNLTDRLHIVDCFNWNDFCQREGIVQYPTVKFFVNGSSRRLETVLSVAEIIRETVLLDLEPLLVAKTSEEVVRALNLSAQLMDHAVLGIGLEDAQVLEEFQKTAAAFKGKALFILAQHQHLPENLQARLSARSVASYSGRLRPDLITKEGGGSFSEFVTEARFDRVMELTWTLFQEFQATKRPIMVLLVLKITPKLECILSRIAVQRRGQFHVTWLYVHPRLLQNRTHNSAFPIFENVKEPTVILLQEGSIHRWTVSSHAEDEVDCPTVSQELDQWIESIKEGKKPADEFVTERQYPPEGMHINCVDNVYPRPKSENEDTTFEKENKKSEKEEMKSEKEGMKSSEKTTNVASPTETKEGMDSANINAADLPKPTMVHNTREEL